MGVTPEISLHSGAPTAQILLNSSMTNASFAEEVCSYTLYVGLEIRTNRLDNRNRYFVLPDCVFADLNWLLLKIDGNVIIQGNATTPDPFERLLALSKVTQLFLTGVRFVNPARTYVHGSYPYTIDWTSFFSKMPSITDLLLDSTQLTGSLPSSLPAALRSASFVQNSLNGTIPATLFQSTASTMKFDASFNSLTGTIPSGLFAVPASGLASLTASFASNRLSGTIPVDLIDTAVESEFRVSFQNNTLTGTIPTNLLVNLRAVFPNLDLSSNQLTGTIPGDIITPLYTTLAFTFVFNVSRNQLNGSIPNWYNGLPTSTLLSSFAIDASRNQLSGTIASTFSPQPITSINGFSFDYGYNSLSGSVPANLFTDGYDNVTANIMTIFLDHNKLTGTLPEQFLFSNLSASSIGLKLGGNALTGSLPANLLADVVAGTSLFLDISDTHLNGTIPNDLLVPFLLSAMRLEVNLSNNAFTGPMPNQIRGIATYTNIDISNNQLSGPLNNTALFTLIGALTSTSDFYFRANQNRFNGTLSFPTNVIEIDREYYSFNVSHNLLTALEFGERVTSVSSLDVSFNTKLTGTIHPALFNSTDSYLETLRASHTALSGPFPNITSAEGFILPIQTLDLSYTAVQFCKGVIGSGSFWNNTLLTSCNLAYTTAHSCPSKYPSICDTRFTSSSEALKPISLLGFVLAMLALALVF